MLYFLIASQIVYSFDSGNEDGAFEIVPETGLIKTKKALDFEKKTNVSSRDFMVSFQ